MADFPLGGLARYDSAGVGSTSEGVIVASSATADTVGSYVELIAATLSETAVIKIAIPFFSIAAAAPVSFLVNIAVGGAGSEVEIISNLHIFTDNAVTLNSRGQWEFPIRVPVGSRVSANCQSSAASADAVKILLSVGAPTLSSHIAYGKVISIGADEANTNGATVDAGAVINTKGAWSEVTTGTDSLKGFCLSIGNNGNIGLSSASFLFDIGVGSAGNEEVAAGNISARTDANERIWFDGSFYGVDIPNSTRIAIRSQSTSNNSIDRVSSYVFHGVR